MQRQRSGYTKAQVVICTLMLQLMQARSTYPSVFLITTKIMMMKFLPFSLMNQVIGLRAISIKQLHLMFSTWQSQLFFGICVGTTQRCCQISDLHKNLCLLASICFTRYMLSHQTIQYANFTMFTIVSTSTEQTSLLL